MSSPQHITYPDIDWNLLWQKARQKKSWHSKEPSDWDKKAASFARRNIHSPYISLFLSHLPLDKSMSVLDVGCGPGTLAIPLSEKVASVTCIDYSQAMLELVKERALEKGITSIRTINCSWDDDWSRFNVDQHDIAISSRSTNVHDLQGALKKLHHFAKRYVFVTDRISPAPFEPEAFEAIGRKFDSGPDYIYTVNCLYSMGIHPSIHILQLEQDSVFASMDEAIASYSWMFRDLSSAEEIKLKTYVQGKVIDLDDQRVVIRRNEPPRWAMIWWAKGL